MQANKAVEGASWALFVISGLGVFSVSLMALMDPRAVMALVHTPLDNTDAYSSIRGVYGGVGITLVVLMAYLVRKDRTAALGFVGLFWASYALSRLLTIGLDGPLGAFGNQWIGIETTLAIAALVLYRVRRRAAPPRVTVSAFAR